MQEEINQLRQKLFKEALQRTYSGCLFDIDGTLTIWGEENIPAFLHEPLARLGTQMPVGVCTARSLNHTIEALAPVFTRAADPARCQANWLLICENGGIGYSYDPAKKNYHELFRIPYPYSPAQREAFFSRIKSALEGKLGQAKMNEISFAFKPLNFQSGTPAEIAAGCEEITGIVNDTLAMMDAKKDLTVGNSGTGVNVYPVSGDKANGIAKFAEFAAQRWGLNFEAGYRDIVVVGDQPQPGGNDISFLDGKYGSPFTVGKLHPEHELPLPVYDLSGKIITGPEGTITLINQLKFRL